MVAKLEESVVSEYVIIHYNDLYGLRPSRQTGHLHTICGVSVKRLASIVTASGVPYSPYPLVSFFSQHWKSQTSNS